MFPSRRGALADRTQLAYLLPLDGRPRRFVANVVRGAVAI